MRPIQLKIYSSADVPRLRYIAAVILGDILGLPWEIVTDKRKLGKHPVINYSDENIKGSFMVGPSFLLFETGVRTLDIEVNEWKGLPVFFRSVAGDFPFDIFAASFFLISRYEEYLAHDTDGDSRFQASSSLAYRHGFLQRPVVDLWTLEFARALLKKFRTLTFKRNDYTAITTFNIDQPFASQGWSLMSSIGGMLRDLAKSGGHAAERYKPVVKDEKDTVGVFNYMSGIIEKYRSDSRFFFPVGDHSKNDKNPSWKNEDYRKLISGLASRYDCGLYHSYRASADFSRICRERDRLRIITGREVLLARFHRLRIHLPYSYQYAHQAGTASDFSMGYPEEAGFRSGIARPHLFYNILTDQQTEMKICPFQFMDTHAGSYMSRNPGESRELIMKLINEVRKTGGTFISIWHNTSFMENEVWKEYREIFEFTLRNQAGEAKY